MKGQRPQRGAAGTEASKYRLPHGLGILYEDSEILVVHKPAGLLTSATGSETEKTAYWILCEYLRKRGEKRRVALVHRLDRDTSGVMLFVKSAAAKKKLMDNWNAMVTDRRYLAVAEGVVEGISGRIDLPLGEDRHGHMMAATPSQAAQSKEWSEAATRWKVLEKGPAYTLLELELETGRRNQIRVHLQAVGHPVAGDSKYGAVSDPVGRLALHAHTLAFYHPKTGRLMEFTDPAPESFYQAIRKKR